MKTNKDLLNFYNVELNTLYKIIPSEILKKGVEYFRVIEKVKGKKSPSKKLVLQTLSWYPDYPEDWKKAVEQDLSFLSEVEYKPAPKQLVNWEEGFYIHDIIWPFKHEIDFIVKKGEKDNEWIEIHTRPEEEYDKEVVSLFKFKKGTEYRNLRKNKKYSLEELGINQPWQTIKAKH